MFWPCETRTSTCRSFETISSGLYRFLAIAVLLDVKDIPQVGPVQWGWIRDSRGPHSEGAAQTITSYGSHRFDPSCLGDENRGYWATFSPAFCGPFIHLLWAWGMMPSSTPSCLPQRHYY